MLSTGRSKPTKADRPELLVFGYRGMTTPIDVPIGCTLTAHRKRVPIGSLSAFWHIPSAEWTLLGLRYCPAAMVCSQYAFIRDNFPCDFGIDSAVAMRDNIPHSFDLMPRNGRMLFTEFICQLTYQFTDLQNAKCGCISINGSF